MVIIMGWFLPLLMQTNETRIDADIQEIQERKGYWKLHDTPLDNIYDCKDSRSKAGPLCEAFSNTVKLMKYLFISFESEF